MQKLIIINGPAGVGKTTISRLLAEHFSNSVCISGDILRNFIVNRGPEVKGRLGYRNGASLILNFLEAGYECVIFEYVFPARSQLDFMLSLLDVCAEKFVFTLWAPLEEVKKREKNRPDRMPLGAQVDETYETMAANLTELGTVIETGGRSIDEVLKEIEEQV